VLLHRLRSYWHWDCVCLSVVMSAALRRLICMSSDSWFAGPRSGRLADWAVTVYSAVERASARHSAVLIARWYLGHIDLLCRRRGRVTSSPSVQPWSLLLAAEPYQQPHTHTHTQAVTQRRVDRRSQADTDDDREADIDTDKHALLRLRYTCNTRV